MCCDVFRVKLCQVWVTMSGEIVSGLGYDIGRIFVRFGCNLNPLGKPARQESKPPRPNRWAVKNLLFFDNKTILFSVLIAIM